VGSTKSGKFEDHLKHDFEDINDSTFEHDNNSKGHQTHAFTRHTNISKSYSANKLEQKTTKQPTKMEQEPTDPPPNNT
jgi:hypothetical protein